METLTVMLPEPHAKQRAFLESPAKRKVICAGRRGGKSTGMAMDATDRALSGHRVLEAAPTTEQTDVFWECCRRYLAPLIDCGLVTKNETRRTLEFADSIGGGRIKTKTAWDADSMRGDYADYLILDEYSLMHPSAWDEVGAPMLLDNNGDAVFIFTPKRRNHAFALHTKAIEDTTGRWGAWKFTSHDNPHLSKEALEEITADMTHDAYRQEILAEFLENAGAVFQGHHEIATMQPQGPIEGHYYVIGLDLGKAQNYTVATVKDARIKPAPTVCVQRWQRVPWSETERRVCALGKQYNRALIVADSTGVGDSVVEAIDDAYSGPVEAFHFTPKSKRQIFEGLQVAIESGDIALLAAGSCPEADVTLAEMDAMEFKAGPSGGITYAPPSGCHDDCVDSEALAVHGLELARPGTVVGRVNTAGVAHQRVAGAARAGWGGASWRG